MKKTIALLLALANFFTFTAFAEDDGSDLFNLDFTKKDDYTQMTQSGSGWTLYGKNPGGAVTSFDCNYGRLRLGHIWGSDSAGFYIEPKEIGLKYDYSITAAYETDNGCGAVAPDYLGDGKMYTTRTRITNGYYMLDFSVERDGIYGVDSSGKWKKLYDGAALELKTYTTFKAEVEGDTAVIYKNGEKLLEYSLLKSDGDIKYSFEAMGKYGKVAAAPCLKGVSLTEYEVAYKYMGMTAGGKRYKDAIPATAKSVELKFNVPVKDGVISAELSADGETVDAETVLDANIFTITPKDGFEYGKEYTVSVTASEEIEGLLNEVTFKTAEDDFVAKDCTFSADSAAVTVGNFSGADKELCVGIFVYIDSALNSWNVSSYELKDGEAAELSSGSVEIPEGAEVKVMIFDSIENIRPLTKSFKKGE